jgi:hypothetical protein
MIADKQRSIGSLAAAQACRMQPGDGCGASLRQNESP